MWKFRGPWNCLVLVNKQITKTSPKEPSGMCFTIQQFGPTSGNRPAKTARSKALWLANALQGTRVAAISSTKSWGWHSVFTKILFTGPSTTSELKQCNLSNPFYFRILTKACVGYFFLLWMNSWSTELEDSRRSRYLINSLILTKRIRKPRKKALARFRT